jgi:DNA-binding NtrC family response regulator
MQGLSIVVFQSDLHQSQALAGTLTLHYHSVHVAKSPDELRTAIARFRAEVAVVDVEASCLAEVTQLHREFPGVSIVCTHRVADEEMWTAALNAGASDMCPACDTQGIVQSAERNALLVQAHA